MTTIWMTPWSLFIRLTGSVLISRKFEPRVTEVAASVSHTPSTVVTLPLFAGFCGSSQLIFVYVVIRKVLFWRSEIVQKWKELACSSISHLGIVLGVASILSINTREPNDKLVAIFQCLVQVDEDEHLAAGPHTWSLDSTTVTSGVLSGSAWPNDDHDPKMHITAEHNWSWAGPAASQWLCCKPCTSSQPALKPGASGRFLWVGYLHLMLWRLVGWMWHAPPSWSIPHTSSSLLSCGGDSWQHKMGCG